METIKTYLFNVFSNLPQTKELENLKLEILNNMEDKYNELKSEGKSENEAIGIVISEFGNIDELINELDINLTNESTNFPTLSKEIVSSFISDKNKCSFFVSIGVVLCILSASILILVSQLLEDKIIFSSLSRNLSDNIPLIPLVLLLIPAVSLFIYSEFKLYKYQYINNGEFNLSTDSKFYVNNQYDNFKSKSFKLIIVAVSLCIVSPITILITSSINENASTYAVSLMLLIISFAVFIFVNIDGKDKAFKALLKIADFSPQKHEENKVISVVASIVWPLAVCIYLTTSFIYSSWHISWIIFPIVGILFGSFCGVYSIIKTKDHN